MSQKLKLSQQVEFHVANHVLLMELVADKLAAYCHLKNLRNFRLVCRQWYSSSLKRWQTESVIVLHGHLADFVEDSSAKNSCAISEISLATYKSFLKLSCLLLGYEKLLKFTKFKIKTGHIAYSQNEINFWKQFGPQMQHLTLENWAFSTCLLKQILHLYLRGVTSLTIINCAVIPNHRIPSVLDILCPSDFSRHQLPTIRKLVLCGEFRQQLKSILLKTCRNIRSLQVNRFDHSDFIESCSAENPAFNRTHGLHGIQKSNFPRLASLSVRLEPEISSERMHRYLSPYATQLEVLQLWRQPLKNCAALKTFPTTAVFKRLKELRFYGSVVENLDFLKLTPSLESLKVNLLCFGKVQCVKYVDNVDPTGHYPLCYFMAPDMCYKSNQNPANYYKVHSGNLIANSTLQSSKRHSFQLTSLRNLSIDYKFDKHSLRTLTRWMPNLQELETVLDNETFQFVCAKWTNLQLLCCLFGSSINDLGIGSFIISHHCQDTAKGVREKRSTLNCLKDLKTFKLETTCEQDRLTDAIAYSFFLKLESLKKLDIWSAKFSTQVFEKLTQKLETINVQNSTSSHKSGEYSLKCCLRERFLNKLEA